MQILEIAMNLCQGLIPAGSYAPHSHSLLHQWDGEENQKCKSEKTPWAGGCSDMSRKGVLHHM